MPHEHLALKTAIMFATLPGLPIGDPDFHKFALREIDRAATRDTFLAAQEAEKEMSENCDKENDDANS